MAVVLLAGFNFLEGNADSISISIGRDPHRQFVEPKILYRMRDCGLLTYELYCMYCQI